MTPSSVESACCPYFNYAVEVLGRRWAASIVKALLAGLHRFTDLEHAIPGMSARMLAGRLRELEAEGIVERMVYPETPVRVHYGLTEKGRALATVVDTVQDWANRWVTPEQAQQASTPQRVRSSAGKPTSHDTP